MRVRSVLLFSLFVLAALAVIEPALAQNAAGNPYNVSWAALSPGDDWSAQVLQSLFPIGTNTAGGTPTGNEATVIGHVVGQFTGFVAAIAAAFVSYITIINIHRAAETSRLLGTGQTWMFAVRVGFAGIMMIPVGGGFSAGQALVLQAAMTGIGMARAVYTNAIQAVGPDAIVVAQPMIPGTEQIVAGLIDNELCMDLVNLAGNTTLVPIPQPLTVNTGTGGFTTWRYSLSTGNEAGDPVCGTVTVNTTAQNAQTVAGVTIDMAAVQQATLTDVLTGSIRSQIQSVAQNLWQTKEASALSPLQTIFTSAVQAYTGDLTAAATSIQSAINGALAADARQARNGDLNLLQNEEVASALGWTGAGAYYLEIAKLNAATLSLLNATPVTTPPTFDGLGPALSSDLAPLETSADQFMTTLAEVVATTDGTSAPSGSPQTLTSATNRSTDATVLTDLFNSLHLSTGILNSITGYLMPSSQVWTDPFGGLMNLGQTLINTALIAMGAAALLSSATTSGGSAIWNFLTGNWPAAAASVAGHAVMSFFGVPIFTGLMAILLPGLVISYVLPMIPWVMWMAGVCGWIILVCEAMIAVPLWMLAHMTVGGDGLHGRAIEGWSLVFNVVFRPTLMVVGLFLGYFVFDCMSWLIRQSFGIAAGFVLSNGWIVSNFIGIAVLLGIFVMTHVVAALMSFRMIALLPHHLPRLIGFTSANRVDIDDFHHRAGWGPGGYIAGLTTRALKDGAGQLTQGQRTLPRGATRYISGPAGASGATGGDADGMDSTLRATTEISPTSEDQEDG